MDSVERVRINALLAGEDPPTTKHDSKIDDFTLDPCNAKDYFHARNVARHDKHWKSLATLSRTVSSPLQPALDSCRHIVFLFLHRGHISNVRSRQQTSIWGWTEQDFDAVFGSLRHHDKYQPVPPPSNSAPTFEAAWGGAGVYQIQISCAPGDSLQRWCSFEDWPQRQGRTHFGCALLASTTLRFMLELTIVFTCNASRVVGRRTEVQLLMTKATINSKNELKFQPSPNKRQMPVRAASSAMDIAMTYMTALTALQQDLTAQK